MEPPPLKKMSKSRCLSPSTAYVCGSKVAKDGILSPNLVFSFNEAYDYFVKRLGLPLSALEDHTISVPCGKCHACQLRKRKDMTCRIANELSVTEKSCFITLTYNEDFVPRTFVDSTNDLCRPFRKWEDEEMSREGCSKRSLYPRDVQLFMKRLRRHLEYHDGIKIRFFCVGEYGTKSFRPHYHLIIFGWEPTDLVPFFKKRDYIVYRSKLIEQLWTFGRGKIKLSMGHSSVSRVTPAVAKYCARYVTKKFERTNLPSDICPEFTLKSVRDGGIGTPWLERYAENILHGTINVRLDNGKITKFGVPQFYVYKVRKTNPSLYLRLRDQRINFVRYSREKSDDDYNNLVRYLDKEIETAHHLSHFEDM